MSELELIDRPLKGVSFDKLLEKLRDDAGVEFAAFGMLDVATSSTVGFSTYGDRWNQHYVENNYDKIDPTIINSISRITPAMWGTLKGRRGYNEVFSAALDYGIPCQGLTIPIRGYLGEVGILSVSSTMSENEWERMIPDQLSILQQGAVFLCDRMSIAKTPLAKILTPQLSETEVKILRLASAGLPVDEIGQRTNLSDRMVSIYLKSCRTKLSALTTPQAIGRAIMKKIIDPV